MNTTEPRPLSKSRIQTDVALLADSDAIFVKFVVFAVIFVVFVVFDVERLSRVRCLLTAVVGTTAAGGCVAPLDGLDVAFVFSRGTPVVVPFASFLFAVSRVPLTFAGGDNATCPGGWWRSAGTDLFGTSCCGSTTPSPTTKGLRGAMPLSSGGGRYTSDAFTPVLADGRLPEAGLLASVDGSTSEDVLLTLTDGDIPGRGLLDSADGDAAGGCLFVSADGGESGARPLVLSCGTEVAGTLALSGGSVPDADAPTLETIFEVVPPTAGAGGILGAAPLAASSGSGDGANPLPGCDGSDADAGGSDVETPATTGRGFLTVSTGVKKHKGTTCSAVKTRNS